MAKRRRAGGEAVTGNASQGTGPAARVPGVRRPLLSGARSSAARWRVGSCCAYSGADSHYTSWLVDRAVLAVAVGGSVLGPVR